MAVFKTDYPFEMPSLVLAALDTLGAVRPTKAVMSIDLVDQLVAEGVEFDPESKDMAILDHLGMWLESQIKMGVMPYAGWAHYVSKDLGRPTWWGYEWYVNFGRTDARHPANRK